MIGAAVFLHPIYFVLKPTSEANKKQSELIKETAAQVSNSPIVYIKLPPTAITSYHFIALLVAYIS